MFQKEVYIARRENLKKLIDTGIALFLGNQESPMNYPANGYYFRQDSTFLYFFGIDLPGLAAVIDFDSGREIIFGDDLDIEDIIWMGNHPSIKEKAQLAGIENSLEANKIFIFIEDALKTNRKIHYIPPYRSENILKLEKIIGISSAFIKKYSSIELIKAIVSLRSIKDQYEIAELEKAASVGYDMHTTAMKLTKPGKYERDIAGIIEGIPISNGGYYSFPIILTQNGNILHNHFHGNKLEEGKLLLVDAGAETDKHYGSDFTRTFPVSGKFSQKQKEIYTIVLNANNLALSLIKPGITYKSIHLEVAKLITKGLIQIGLMKGDVDEAVQNGAHALFFPHGLGHMMGLDVHDMEDLGENYVGYDNEIQRSTQFGLAYLRLARKLQPGFVLTVEPGIYFIAPLIEKWRNEKINHNFINFNKIEEYGDFGGIRLEDDVLVTTDSNKLLGNRIPITIEEIENLMQIS
jgi:Xaa-Pro aminopeptidase